MKHDLHQPVQSVDDPDLALPSGGLDELSPTWRVARLWRPAVLPTVILIALGAAAGANARYYVAQLAAERFGTAFPYGTLIINISGSLLLGMIYALLLRLQPGYAPALRLFVGVGLLGGYTTFSSFSYETAQLFLEQRSAAAIVYPLASVAAGVLSCLLGIALAERIGA
jgi:CrcB protein